MQWIFVLLFASVVCTLQIQSACRKDTLRLVHVVFRHGDRTTDDVYPKDPHKNFTYPHLGYGQLTKTGKQKEYKLGAYLSSRYNCVLNVYTPDIIHAVSTDTNRTKMSLELVLAGLFPPSGEQVWNPALMWQPVPYSYTRARDDHILGYPIVNCPIYKEEYEAHLSNLNFIHEEEDIFHYLSTSTGLNISKPQHVYDLYFTLKTEQEWGLELPKWTENVWPEEMSRLAVEEYRIQTGKDKLRRLSGGFLLKKIIEDTEAQMNGTLNPPTRKMFLYSGHEYNIAYMLILLDLFFPHVPPYGSFIIVEVHEIKGVYGFKILYQPYINESPLVMKIPGCEIFCPYKKFIKLVGKHLPTEDDKCRSKKAKE